MRKRTIIGPTKRKKICTVDFCDTLAEILRAAKQEQKQGKQKYREFHQLAIVSKGYNKEKRIYVATIVAILGLLLIIKELIRLR